MRIRGIRKVTITFLKKHWKVGLVGRFKIPGDIREELLKFGIISLEGSNYVIDRAAFSKHTKGRASRQSSLFPKGEKS